MKKTFEILNVKCSGCANSVKKALRDEFGEVDVNLDVMPRQITLDIEENQIKSLRANCKFIGYPFIDEDLSTIEQVSTKAKSFVSCAVGKMENKG